MSTVNKLSLTEAIKKAVEIKKNGGTSIYVGLSNSQDDPLNKVRNKSIKLINKFISLQ